MKANGQQYDDFLLKILSAKPDQIFLLPAPDTTSQPAPDTTSQTRFLKRRTGRKVGQSVGRSVGRMVGRSDDRAVGRSGRSGGQSVGKLGGRAVGRGRRGTERSIPQWDFGKVVELEISCLQIWPNSPELEYVSSYGLLGEPIWGKNIHMFG